MWLSCPGGFQAHLGMTLRVFWQLFWWFLSLLESWVLVERMFYQLTWKVLVMPKGTLRISWEESTVPP